jgi:hypothetical protein
LPQIAESWCGSCGVGKGFVASPALNRTIVWSQETWCAEAVYTKNRMAGNRGGVDVRAVPNTVDPVKVIAIAPGGIAQDGA